ncbi:MAG: Ig-like domain-containing protein [Pirellulales bacterium]
MGLSSATATVLAGSTLSIGGTWSNTGTIHNTSGTLNLGGTFNLAALGTVNRSGGTVNLTGTFNNAATTLDTTTHLGGTLQLVGGSIQGGTVNGPLATTSTGGTLNGITLNGNLDLAVTNAFITITNGLTLNGAVNLSGESSRIDFAGTQSLLGTATVVYSNVNNSVRQTVAGGTLTLGPNTIVRGGSNNLYGARLGYSDQYGGPTNVNVVNEGTISADVSGLSIVVQGGSLTNSGVIEAKNGGRANLGNLSVTNLSGGTLTGGTWRVYGTSQLRLPGSVTTNAANILLDGAASAVFVGSGSTDALFNLVTNTASGNLTLQNGRVFTPTGDFTSSGNLSIDATSRFGNSVAQLPPTSGLVSFWKGDGNASDSVGSNPGALNNGATASTAGVQGSTFSFDGVNDHVAISDAANLRPTNLTIESWVNFNAVPGGSTVYSLVAKPVGSADEDSFAVWYSLGALRAYVGSSGTTSSSIAYNWTPTTGTWYHVAFTFDDPSDTLRLYVNGALATSGTTSRTIGYDGQSVYLGADTTSSVLSYPFNGKLDEVRFYNRALTATEVQSTYNYESSHLFTQTGGTTTVNGQWNAVSSAIQGGSLLGSGTLSGPLTVASGAQLAPGNSPGILSAGNTSLQAGSNFRVEVNSPYATAGTDYDQLRVTGTVSLNGANLLLTGGIGAPPVVSPLRIIDNDGSDPVVGTFASLPEGATVSVNDLNATISYVGGDGNDVVLIPFIPNHPPEIFAQTLAVNENATLVGAVAATDPDLVSPGDTQTFSITGNGPDDSRFSISSAGVLSFLAPPDYENPLDVGGTAGDNSYRVEVKVVDSQGEFATAIITVDVQPLNDNSPIFTSAAAATVPENSTAVLTINATDADRPIQTITYSLVGGADQSRFTIVSGNQLRFVTSPDYENPTDANGDRVYLVQIQADDNLGRTTVQSVSVTVSAVNDNAPSFTSPTTVTVAENTTVVHTLSAIDADLPAQSISYSITGGVDAAKFSLFGGTQVRFVFAPDFETPTDTNGDNVYQVQVTASDSQGLSTPQTIQVTVVNGNEIPTAVTDTGSAFEDGSAVSIDLATNDFDVDVGDVLHIASLNTTGTMGQATINGDGRSVTYDPGAHFQDLAVGATRADIFRYVVSDVGGLTSTGTVTVTIQGKNDAPVANNDTAATSSSTPVSILVRANDVDIDGDSLVVQSVTSPAHGSVTISGDQLSVIYTPDAGFAATDSFTYVVSDGHGGTATAAVSVVVNDAPLAVNDRYYTEKNAVLTIGVPGVLANDSDPNPGDTLSVAMINNSAANLGAVVTLPSGAKATLNSDGSLSYDPNGQFAYLAFAQETNDSFTYTVADHRGGVSTATVTITVTNSLYELPDLTLNSSNISFSPVNPAAGSPVTIFATIRNAGYTAAGPFDVSFRDFGALLGTASVTGLAAGASTTVSINTTYPSAGYRLISVTADPGLSVAETHESNNSANAVLQVGTPVTPSATIHVTTNSLTATPGSIVLATGTGFYDFDAIPGSNDFPVQGGAVTVEVLDASTLTVLSTYSGTHTNVNGDLSQAILAPSTAGIYLLRVTVTDSSASNYSVAGFDLVSLTVATPTPFDPPPPFLPPPPSTQPPQILPPAQIELPSGGGYLSGASSVPGGPASIPNNVYVYSEHIFFSDANPDIGEEILVFAYINFHGTNDPVAPFEVNLNDIFPLGGALQTFTMGTALVSFPAGESDTPQVVVIPYRNTAAGAHILQIDTTPPTAKNVSILDDDATRLLQVGPPSPTLDVQKAGVLLNDADHNNRVSPGDTLRYTLIVSNTGDLSITGATVNDVYDAALVDSPANITNGGVDLGDSITWMLGALAGHQQVTLHYELPISASVPDDTILANVALLSADGVAAVADASRIPIHVNDAPTVLGESFPIPEDQSVTFSALANDLDVDGDTLSITSVSSPAHGTATLGAGGIITYVPTPDYFGADSFTYTVDDGWGGTAIGTVSINLASVVDIAGDAVNTPQNTAVTIAVLANDSFEGTPSAVTVTPAANGVVVVNANHTVTYTPNAYYSGIDSFTYSVHSGGVTETATVSLTIAPGGSLRGTIDNDLFLVIYSATDIRVSLSTNGGPSLILGVFPLGTEVVVDGLGGTDSLTLGLLASQWGDLTDLQLTSLNSYLAAPSGHALNLSVPPASDFASVNIESAELFLNDDDSLVNITTCIARITNGAQIVVGTPNNDTLTGSYAADLIFGLDGNDVLWGFDGADCLLGGAGDDVVHGDAGDDWMLGGAGNDLLYGDWGFDSLVGGTGQDLLDGGFHDDQLEGGPDADTILGGPGYDTFRIEKDDAAADLMNGGDNTDSILNVAAAPVVLANFNAGTNSIEWWFGNHQPIFGTETGDSLSFMISPSYSMSLSAVSYIDGRGGPDIITGTFGTDDIRGGEGNDVLIGLGGSDTLLGGNGDDSLDGGDGVDYLYGGDGADTITTGGGRDNVYFVGDLLSLDTITDFALYSDMIHLQAYAASYSALTFTIAGTQTTMELANGKKIRLLNWNRVLRSSQIVF